MYQEKIHSNNERTLQLQPIKSVCMREGNKVGHSSITETKHRNLFKLGGRDDNNNNTYTHYVAGIILKAFHSLPCLIFD